MNIMRTVALTKESTKDILENLLKRSPNNYGKFEAAVDEILNKVKTEGDAALFAYTKEFDKTDISADTIKVTEEEIKEAYEAVDPALIDVIRKALVNIRSYHEKQRQNSWFTSETNGTMLGQKVTALERVGVYVPGGKAVYPSSVLMNVLPAKVAGVDRIVMCTPPGKDGKVYPSTLVAAKEAGVDEIYKVGGAQAIAAMAFGTESVPKVDKIVGPGNIYVALAKKAVFGYVSIDSIAGPSEILVLADETANPRYVAADLLSQAEHDEMASAILITTSQKLAEEVSAEIDQFVVELSRKEIIQKSLRPAMQPHAATYALLDELERAGEAVGQKVTCLVTGGGSDGNFISHYGVATLDGCGPCGGKMHTREEYLMTKTVEQRLDLMYVLLTRLFRRCPD